MDMRELATYHRVRVPVSLAVWYSGREGTTVGMGATELLAASMKVPVA